MIDNQRMTEDSKSTEEFDIASLSEEDRKMLGHACMHYGPMPVEVVAEIIGLYLKKQPDIKTNQLYKVTRDNFQSSISISKMREIRRNLLQDIKFFTAEMDKHVNNGNLFLAKKWEDVVKEKRAERERWRQRIIEEANIRKIA